MNQSGYFPEQNPETRKKQFLERVKTEGSCIWQERGRKIFRRFMCKPVGAVWIHIPVKLCRLFCRLYVGCGVSVPDGQKILERVWKLPSFGHFIQIRIEARHTNPIYVKASLSYRVAMRRNPFSLRKYFSTRWRSLYSHQSQRRSNLAPFLEGIVGSPPFS